MKHISMKVATFFPENKRNFKELLQASNCQEREVLSSGIQTLHTCDVGVSSTALSVRAFEKLASQTAIDPSTIDCVAWIAEGVDDFIYMDTAKTFIEDIKGTTDGEVHTYQLYGGAGGTIQAIHMISNQLMANPSIHTAAIVTSLIWESHSDHRLLYPTYMGDGAGVLLLENGAIQEMIIGVKLATLDAYNTSYAIPYGGTKHPITQEVIKKEAFRIDMISQVQHNDILDSIIKEASMMINRLCDATKYDIHTIDYIGIAGFHKEYSDELLKMLPTKEVIDPLAAKGYIGSLGVFEVLNQFLNTDTVAESSIMLVINLGLEGNIESMLIKKPISIV